MTPGRSAESPMAAAQDGLSGGQLDAALANESAKLVADFTSRGTVRNVGSAAPARLSRKSTTPQSAYAFWQLAAPASPSPTANQSPG